MIPTLAIVNRSWHVTTAQCEDIVAFTGLMLRDVSRAHGTVCWHAELVDDARNVLPGHSILYLLDDPDTSGALGYHDVDPHGFPYSKVFVVPTLDNGGSVIGRGAEEDSNSVLGVVTHEAVEEALNAYVNAYVLMADGKTMTALEGCDACEDRGYLKHSPRNGQAWVSDFLLPSWFHRLGKPPYTFGDGQRAAPAIKAPFQMTPGGYRIDWDVRGAERDTFPRLLLGAEYPKWRVPHKHHPRSRAALRLRAHLG